MTICSIQCGSERSALGSGHGSTPEAKTPKLLPDQLIPAIISTGLRVGVAESLDEIRGAGGLVRRRYTWRGYDVEAAAEDCARVKRAGASQEITFVAADCDTTIGTLTLGLDGPFGLRAEQTHADVIETARSAGRRVCELTRLAVAETADSRPVLASLFSLAYAVGLTIHGVTDVFIEVNPRHVAFYSRVLGFVVAAGEVFCERVRAPSVLLHAEVEALAGRLEALAFRAFGQPILAQAA